MAPSSKLVPIDPPRCNILLPPLLPPHFRGDTMKPSAVLRATNTWRRRMVPSLSLLLLLLLLLNHLCQHAARGCFSPSAPAALVIARRHRRRQGGGRPATVVAWKTVASDIHTSPPRRSSSMRMRLGGSSNDEIDVEGTASLVELKKLSVTDVDGEKVSFESILSRRRRGADGNEDDEGTVLVFLRHLG